LRGDTAGLRRPVFLGDLVIQAFDLGIELVAHFPFVEILRARADCSIRHGIRRWS
jgi:hypothetical protein